MVGPLVTEVSEASWVDGKVHGQRRNTMLDEESERPPTVQFPTTHWSRVAAALELGGPGTREALGALCSAYWYPLFAFIRRRGHGAEEARDLVQEYFTRLLQGRCWPRPTRPRGDFGPS